MKIIKPTWDEVISVINEFASNNPNRYSDVVAVSRGGLIPAQIIAYHLNILRVHSFGVNFYNEKNEIQNIPIVYQALTYDFTTSKILIVDDIADSGKTMKYVIDDIKNDHRKEPEIVTYSIYKKNSSKYSPHYYGEIIDDDIWVEFPWEKNNE